MPPFRIISFDGGGVRGALMLAVLLRLDGLVPGWRRRVDLYSGTSVGALIALGLAAGYEPGELLVRFRGSLGDVFRDSWWDDIRDVGNAFGAEYDSSGLRKTAHDLFGETRLSQLDRFVVIPAIRLTAPGGARPKFFHNLPGSDSDGARLACDVAAYSAAAPVYFPSIDGFADGGLIANHPGLAAVSTALDERNLIEPSPRLEDVRLLALGTGRDPVRVPNGAGDWGWVRWARPLIRIMVEATVDVPDFQCRQLLGAHYHRLQPTFPEDEAPGLDDLDSVQRLELMGRSGMTNSVEMAREWLETVWAPPQCDDRNLA